MVLESNTLDVLFVKDGQQGEDGKILYTWIKYAKDASGTGITDDPNGAIYIGISYNNESSIESNDPTHYAWTKIQGADGKKGEDAYTIFLENENISFATDKNRNPLSEQAYTSGITIMKGAKPVTDFTIGDIAKTQGIAVAKTDTAIAISVVNGNPLPNDNGEIEIPITVGGTVFKKILTWTCAKKGDQGEKGENGKDGTSVTIINKSITYQLSTSGTVIPKGTWQTSPQTIPEGQYQWTKTSVTYSDGNKTESYSISYHGKNGNDGTSVKTTGTSVKYQVGDSGTTKPTGTWQSNVPTVAQGKYLWTQTIVNYSDGNSTESYSVSYRGIDGSNGVNGMNTATIYLYQRATSTPSKPSNTLTYTFSTTKITGTLNNGWSTTIPTGTDAVYVTVASVSSKNDTATIATSVWSAPVVLAQNGKTGSDGKAGLNVATIYLYQRNTSKPSKPSASVTYTFSTGVASGLNNGWSQKIPNGTNPLYVTLATASSNTATDTILSSEWSDVVVMAQNGEDGQDGISPKVSLLKSGDTTTISIVDATGTHTQTVKDGTNGTPGAAGKDGKTSYFHVKYSNDGGKTFTGNSGEDTGTYMGSYTDYTEADSTDVKKYNWVKVKGDKGDKGDTGQKGQDGTSVKITSKSVTYQTSTSGTIAPTGTWVTTVPTINNGQYLWTKTTVQYSDGNKTEAYSVSYKGTNGTNGTSVTVSKTEVTYQVSTSGTTAPTGTWSTTMPSCDQGQYLWTKTYVKYSDGKDTTSYSVSYKGVDGEKFAFNMLRETNQGSKHWVNMGASGKYSVESITTEDSINAVKLICTEPIASNEWQFCEFSDYEMLKSLKASTAYTLSYDIKTNRSGKISHNIKTGGGQKPFFANDISCKVLGNETWEHVSLKMTSGTTLPNLDRQVIYMFDNALSKVGYSIIKNLKLTEGIVDTPWAPHPEDLEGRGVSETVQYYLATSQASGVTSSTSGWSTDITTQKLTADKKYLWNCYQTKYSDGTSEPISTPKVIGVYGDKGNGIVASVQRPNKTEFWWSQVGAVGHKDTFDDSSNTRNNCRVGDIFTVMGTSTEGNSHTVYYKSATDSGDLAGECINHVIAESGADAKNLSITPSSQYFKSTDGGKTFAPNTITIKPTIQGEINFGKWQYSIDGGVSFADVVSGQKGLMISNNVLTVSKDSSLYSDAVTMVTFRAVASDSSFYDTCSIAKLYDVTDIEIGGVNLIKNSNFADGINKWETIGITCTVEADSTYGHHIKFSSGVAGDSNHRLLADAGSNFNHTKNTTYTLSFYAKASANTQVQSNIAGGANPCNYSLTTSWQRYTTTYKASATGSLTFWAVEANKDIYLANIKLERGNKPTDYTVSPEDVQTAILSTKNSIDSVSSKVDTNTKSIQDKVSKTTYERELTLVKGDLSKANDGLNKWRYEIYPKSLFASEYQGKSTIDIFARNLNLVPSQTLLLDDASLSTGWDYGDSHIAYALTFIKMSAKKDVTTKMFNDDGASLYVNGGLVITRPSEYTNGEEITFTLAQGWNCIEVVVNEVGGSEGFRFSTTLSKLSECQMMNCYYGTPVARQSRITNQLVDVTKNLTGVTSTVQDVMTAVGNSGNITEFKNNYSKWKQSVDKIESRVGSTYVTNEKFDGLEIGGRNLLTKDDCNMSKWQNLYPAHCKITSNDYSNHVDYVPTGGEWEIVYKKISVTKGQKYILSFDYKINKAYNYLSGQKYGVYLSTSVPTNAAPTNIITNGQYVIENTVTNIKRGMITFTAAVDTLYIVINGGCIDDNQTGLSFEFNKWKLEKGNKATDWTPAPEDDEINGQNLVSNLPSNWEQGSFQDSKTNVGCDYDTNKSSMTNRIRVKELVPVSGTITISNAYSNQSKKSIQHWITAFDINKKWLGASYVSTAWSDFPRTVDMKDAKYIAVIVGYTDNSAITPSDISQICLKVERGTSATPFTLAPEDVNGKIVNVETIANQTAKKFEWIVKGGDSSSNFTLTDRVADLVAERINFKGLVTFSGTTNLIENSNMMNGLANITSECKAIKVIDDSTYRKALVITPIAGGRIFWGVANVWKTNITYSISFVAKSSVAGQKIKPSRSLADWGDEITLTTSYTKYTTRIKSTATADGGTLSFSFSNAIGDVTLTNVKLETGMNPTDWSPAPGDYITQASLVRNWTTNTTWIDGGKIYTGSITADKIATDAIKSRNYISSGGTQGSFLNLSDGSFQSPNLSWDANGNLIAKNANLSGEITAKDGTIGKYKITDQWLITGSGSTCTGIGGNQAFWAGAEDSNSAPFRVNYDGSMISTKGKIGDWKIDKMGLYNDFIVTFGVDQSDGTWLETFYTNYSAKTLYKANAFNNIFLGNKICCMDTHTEYTYLNDNSNKGDITYVESVILENGRINLHSSQYSDSRFALIPYDNYGSHLTLSGEAIEFSSYEADGTYSERNVDAKYTYTYISSDTIKTADVYCSNILRTNNLLVYEIISGRDIHLTSSANQIQLNASNQGSIELYGQTPFIDFHYNYSGDDYTSRIIANGSNLLSITGNLWVDADIHAGSWLYASEVHTSGAVVIASDSESFYWAHGYQIARGTSWGGVCVGDDSQQLRLYGSSIWAAHGISTSDENLKENFTTLDQYEDFYMNLNPIGFNYIGDYDGKKTHFGFGAHKTEDILESEGYDADKFAVVTHRPLVQEDIEKRFGKDVEVDIKTEYGVSYTEFIALNTHMIQKTRRELEQAKQEKADLETRLQAIEAKLGL